MPKLKLPPFPARRALPWMMAAALVLCALFFFFSLAPPAVFRVPGSSDTPIVLPLEDYSAADGAAPGEQIYRFPCPELLSMDESLCVYLTHQYISIFLDDHLLYQCSEPDAGRVTPGRYWAVAPLKKMDAGHTLLLVVRSADPTDIRPVPLAVITDKNALLFDTLNSEWPQLISGMLCFVIGLIYVIIAVSMRLPPRSRGSILYLGLFTLVFGVCRTADLRAVTLIASLSASPGAPQLLFCLSLAGFVLTPLLIACFLSFEHSQERTYHRLSLLIGLGTLLSLLLQLTGLLKYQTLALLSNLLWSLEFSVSLFLSLRNLLRRWEGSYQQWLQCLYAALSAATLADLALYQVGRVQRPFEITLYVFLLHSVVRGLYNIRFFLRQRDQLHQMEIRLSNQRMSMLISQIRPHFIFNTMNTIYSLCDQDPALAKQAIHDFSRFLRIHFETMDQQQPIPFSQELELVRFYLSIEQVRFQDALSVRYDIDCTDFSLPPLSLQPLAENAVRHGIRQKSGPGTVTISTRESGSEWIVSVRDDGAGFDPSLLDAEEAGRHIGIANVQARLRQMCGGMLTLSSAPGQGTTATIRIPKEGFPSYDDSDR